MVTATLLVVVLYSIHYLRQNPPGQTKQNIKYPLLARPGDILFLGDRRRVVLAGACFETREDLVEFIENGYPLRLPG